MTKSLPKKSDSMRVAFFDVAYKLSVRVLTSDSCLVRDVRQNLGSFDVDE
jgi:hypothetical protein